jgi:hypothetical protein
MSLLLAATLAALACGPLLYALTRSVPQWRRGFDLLVWISIVGLLLVEIIPHAVEDGGGLGFVWLIAGFALPTVLERSFRRIRETTHWVALGVAIVGLAVHALADGAILANIDAHTHDLGLSIALHSLPIGLAVCWLLIPPLGWMRSVMVIGGIGAATLVGFVITPDLPQLLGQQGWAWLQMSVAGLLMHALTGRPHLHHGVPQADPSTEIDAAPDPAASAPALRSSP